MPHVAGLRGILPDTTKLDAGGAIEAPPDLVAGLASGALVRDPVRAVYRYHQTFSGPGGRSVTRKSFVCAVRLSPWSEGTIRAHEATSASEVEAELTRIRNAAAHDGPVLTGVRDSASEVDRLFRKTESGRATLKLTTGDGCVHQLWRAQDAELLGKLRTYFAPKKLHLLEGHARYEAMLAYQAELATKGDLSMYSSANYALACIVPMDDPGLVVAARHKIVRGVEVTREAALAAVSRHFIVERLDGAATDLARLGAALADTVAHQPAMVVVFAGDADAWKLTLSPDVNPLAEGVEVDRAIAKLDPVVVDQLFLARALPGAQISSHTDATQALRALGQGAHAAIIIRPLSLQQLVHVDELGLRLPPHSTAFYPPLAPGLIAMAIDRDEDLV